VAETSLLQRAAAIHAASRKHDDFLWARLTARWPAAWLLAALHRAPLTPDGLSLASLVLGLASCAAFAAWPGSTGVWVGFALGQLAYIVDCMDGMLARTRGGSAHGRALDFAVDAVKQVALFPAIGWRVWSEAGKSAGDGWLMLTVVSGPVVAAALLLTMFLRSPEVTGGERPTRAAHDSSLSGRAMALFAFLLNYPSWILVPVIFQRLDVFLLISVPLYALHAGWSLLRISRLARGARS
jgi:phosphatidylglycerophosphate synthase